MVPDTGVVGDDGAALAVELGCEVASPGDVLTEQRDVGEDIAAVAH